MSETKNTNNAVISTRQDDGWKWAALAIGAVLLVILACLIGCLLGGIAGVSLFGLRSSRHMSYPPESDILPIPATPEPWREPMPLQPPEPGDPLEPLIGRAWLGVTYRMSEKGAQIVEVTPGSPADQANLRVGDVVIAVEDKLVTEQMDLKEHILRYEPGDRVALTILRNNRKEKVSVRLGVRSPGMMQQQPILPED